MSEETIEEPCYPCPALIKELERMRLEAYELAKSIPQLEGWGSTLWDAKAAILAPYYHQLTAYKNQQEYRRKRRQERQSDRIEENAENRLNSYLQKYEGRFCMANVLWTYGNVPEKVFRKYLDIQVQKGTLITEKDDLGRVWYSRPVEQG